VSKIEDFRHENSSLTINLLEEENLDDHERDY